MTQEEVYIEEVMSAFIFKIRYIGIYDIGGYSYSYLPLP